MIYSDGRPYYTLNAFYKEKFGTKVAKLSLDGGFTCPNRDGTISYGGCKFCSGRGSGDFTIPHASIPQQIQLAKERYQKKWGNTKYIAYFQAFTNTYAPVEILKQKYKQAMEQKDVVGISIATRPDCLSLPILELLEECHRKMPLWVELGLQTSHEKSAQYCNRGYDNSVFEQAVQSLYEKKIPIVVHCIIGLPFETEKDYYHTIAYCNQFPIEGLKLQLLHVLKGTELAQDYKQGKFETLSMEKYVSVICNCIAMLRPNIVIHRITGDAPPDDLIAPLWSLKKRNVLNAIHKELKRLKYEQGQFYHP